MTTQTTPKSLMEAAFATFRESIRLVGDNARGSRAKADALAFAAWKGQDIVLTQKVFEQAFVDNLSSDDLNDSYARSRRSELKAVLFSSKPEVIAIVEQWQRGQYLVGLSKAAEVARGTVRGPRKGSEAPAAPAAKETEGKETPVTVAPKAATAQDVLPILDTMSLADLRIIAEHVQKLLTAKQSKAA